MKRLIFILIWLIPNVGQEKIYDITVTIPEKVSDIETLELAIPIATVYHAVESQTDNTPLITASGAKINPDNPQKFIAISQDLLEYFKFGDTVIITGGPRDSVWIVEDVMNKKWNMRLDFLVKAPEMGVYRNLKIKKI